MSFPTFKARNHPQQVKSRGALASVDDRGTPPEVFGPQHELYDFTVDVAANAANAKVERFIDRAEDGLKADWTGERVWCNPPFSAIGPWVEKAWAEEGCPLIVMLLPANRTEQGWWQDHVEPRRDREGSPLRVTFLRGRPRFLLPGETVAAPNSRPPFGCVVLVWDRRTP